MACCKNENLSYDNVADSRVVRCPCPKCVAGQLQQPPVIQTPPQTGGSSSGGSGSRGGSSGSGGSSSSGGSGGNPGTILAPNIPSTIGGRIPAGTLTTTTQRNTEGYTPAPTALKITAPLAVSQSTFAGPAERGFAGPPMLPKLYPGSTGPGKRIKLDK